MSIRKLILTLHQRFETRSLTIKTNKLCLILLSIVQCTLKPVEAFFQCLKSAITMSGRQGASVVQGRGTIFTSITRCCSRTGRQSTPPSRPGTRVITNSKRNTATAIRTGSVRQPKTTSGISSRSLSMAKARGRQRSTMCVTSSRVV